MSESKIELSEEEVAFSEIIGDLVEQWGFKRHLGRIWSLLYLRSSPISPSDIQDALALSAGSVSAMLTELQMWGVVKRIRMAGDRNFYYEPEVHIWKSVSNVLRARELRILEEAQAGLDALAGKLTSKGDKKDGAEFQVKRIRHVRDAIDTASSLFNIVIGGNPLALTKTKRILDRLKAL